MRTFEDLIKDTGGLGRFQVTLIATVTSCLVFMGWSMLQMSFAGLIPDYHCVTDGFNGSDLTGNNSNINVCYVNGTTCSSFAFIGPRHTVISEWDLVCDRKWAKQIIVSVQMGGVLVGAMIVGQMSDSIGRRKSLYIFNFYHICVNLVAGFSVSWVMFAVMRFFVGIGIGGIFVVVFTYPMEFLPIRWRILMGSLPSWSMGVSVFAIAAYILEDWKHLHFALSVACLPSMLGWFYVPESIRWLTIRGRIDEAENVFKRIARINNKTMPTDTNKVLQNIMETELRERENAKTYTYTDLFKTRKMTRHSLINVFWWSNLSMVYYGISFGISSLSGNIYLNMFVMAALEYPFRLVAAFFNNLCGRKPTVFVFFTLATLASLGCLLCQVLVPEEDRGVYINWFSIVAIATTGAAWSGVQTWTSELYPTSVRNLGYGLGNMGARIGGIAAPFLLNFDDIPLVSYVVMVSVFVICTGLTLIPTETKGQLLKDSMPSKNSKQSTIYTLQDKSNGFINGGCVDLIVDEKKDIPTVVKFLSECMKDTDKNDIGKGPPDMI